jgi:predicted Rossmann fold flavoprotein
MKVIVIGGGPAGMMAAITSAEHQNEVILIEKKERLGRKLLITGKGRCNITSSLPTEEWINNIPGNGKFLYSALQEFTNQDIIQFLKKQGLRVKEERGNRIFPVTDRSQDVLTCFEKQLKELKVRCLKNETVEEILVQKITNKEKEEKDNREITVIGIKTNKQTIKADKIILATGGKSYPLTGSTGDGYKLAQKLGHTITAIKPSLVPLEIEEKEAIKQLQGLSLKNVKVHFIDETKQKQIDEDFGEMIFTHFGVSGPIILSESAHLVRVPAIEQKMQDKKIKLQIDLKPALSAEKLEERILRDFSSEKNKQFKNSLGRLLPQKLIPIVIQRSKISPEKKVNEITKQERKNLVKTLKTLTFTIKKFRPIEEAIITSGGISIKEINPKTMESKKVKGLYFAGEIIDVDAYTGGFNLQIAYSTGYVAGKS